jgi:RNA polymerase sigma factor (sigma-70 family)
MNDWELVGAYVQGDDRAFEGLVAKYFRMVYTMAARQVGDPHLAEDVAQSVFIILSRKAGKLSSGVSLCGWLLQTTRFVARDAVKMRWRRQRHEQEFAASLDCASPAKADPNAIEAVLDEALLALPAAEQVGVMAHFFEGKNFKEIGQMLAISEDGAQKRVSRSLSKLRAYLSKRGVKVSLAAVAGLLTAQFAPGAAAQTLPSALQAAQAAAEGKMAAGNALALADRATRLLQWHSAISIGLKVSLAVLLILGGSWAWRERNSPASSAVQATDPRIEALAKRWSAMVLRFASLMKDFAQIPPGDPRFQAIQAQANTIGQDATVIRDELKALLTPPHERDQVAEFLTAEIGETLKLGPSEKHAVYWFVRDRLGRGATLNDAMKTMAQDIPSEAVQIKALLSPEQRRNFDSVYQEGSGFWFYLRIAVEGGEKMVENWRFEIPEKSRQGFGYPTRFGDAQRSVQSVFDRT